MTSRERLWAIHRGEPADRPAVSFYYVNGYNLKPDAGDPYCVQNDPSWQPLLKLGKERTDRIVYLPMRFINRDKPIHESRSYTERGKLHTVNTFTVKDRTFISHFVRDPGVATGWQVQHLLKDAEDLRYWLKYVEEPDTFIPDVSKVLEAEEVLGENGIVYIWIPTPLCVAADYFSMADYLVVAMTEPALFHEILKRLADRMLKQVKAFAAALPGRAWSTFGPEYATEPYLPPSLFREYVNTYDQPMLDAIHAGGGVIRLHCHGRVNNVLDYINDMGYEGIDPVEPPMAGGDITLAEAKRRFKGNFLAGNIEMSEIELLDETAFAQRVKTALSEGTDENGGGFILVPTSFPVDRVITPRIMRNHEIMAELTENYKP